jgi:hypothetical protein
MLTYADVCRWRTYIYTYSRSHLHTDLSNTTTSTKVQILTRRQLLVYAALHIYTHILALSIAHRPLKYEAFLLWQPPAYVSIRQHTSAYVSIRQHTSAYVSIPLKDEAFLLLQAQDAVFNRALSDDSRLRTQFLTRNTRYNAMRIILCDRPKDRGGEGEGTEEGQGKALRRGEGRH